MNYAEIKNCDIANGPGVRVSLFVSGCAHHCKGCFNEVAWDYDYGTPFTEETENHILKLLQPPHIKGLTLLGGEPFDPKNQEPLLRMVERIRNEMPEKSIWAFTGYILERDLLSGRVGNLETVKKYLSCLDVLVDGPFILEQKNLSLRFRGSENQRLIDIPNTLKEGKIVLWEDWQKKGKMI